MQSRFGLPDPVDSVPGFAGDHHVIAGNRSTGKKRYSLTTTATSGSKYMIPIIYLFLDLAYDLKKSSERS
jgi:hypothetical protein